MREDPLKLVIERTRSRTGLHRRARRAYAVTKAGQLKELTPTEKASVRGTYREGEAYVIEVPPLKADEALVYLDVVMGPRGRLKGRIWVFDERGGPRLEMKFAKLKLRRVRGDRSFFWAVKVVLDKLGLPVRRTNLLTGSS